MGRVTRKQLRPDAVESMTVAQLRANLTQQGISLQRGYIAKPELQRLLRGIQDREDSEHGGNDEYDDQQPDDGSADGAGTEEMPPLNERDDATAEAQNSERIQRLERELFNVSSALAEIHSKICKEDQPANRQNGLPINTLPGGMAMPGGNTAGHSSFHPGTLPGTFDRQNGLPANTLPGGMAMPGGNTAGHSSLHPGTSPGTYQGTSNSALPGPSMPDSAAAMSGGITGPQSTQGTYSPQHGYPAHGTFPLGYPPSGIPGHFGFLERDPTGYTGFGAWRSPKNQAAIYGALRSKESVACHNLPKTPIVSQHLRNEMISGKNINLAKLLIPDGEEYNQREILITGGGAIPVKSKTDPRLLRDLSLPEFISAFTTYKDTVKSECPDWAAEMETYLLDIIDMSKSFGGTLFYQYHKLFSLRAADVLEKYGRRVNWAVRDNDLYCKIFAGRRANACSLCGSISHDTLMCQLHETKSHQSQSLKRSNEEWNHKSSKKTQVWQCPIHVPRP